LLERVVDEEQMTEPGVDALAAKPDAIGQPVGRLVARRALPLQIERVEPMGDIERHADPALRPSDCAFDLLATRDRRFAASSRALSVRPPPRSG
jgi:hypothetical protein